MKRFIVIFLLLVSFVKADAQVDSLKAKVLAALPSLEGWCSQEKALAFIDLTLEVKPKVYVEIGVFGGRSIFPVASALKFLGQGIVIGIDPWDKVEAIKYYDPVEDQTNLQWWAKVNFYYVYSSYLSMLKKYDLEKFCKTIRASAEEAVSEIESIDILYLDGNHCEEPSLQDVTLYLPKVKSGGYIWMNDTLWPERQAAAEMLLQECDAVKLIDNGNCILFKKR